jgi:hypothetical protein
VLRGFHRGAGGRTADLELPGSGGRDAGPVSSPSSSARTTRLEDLAKFAAGSGRGGLRGGQPDLRRVQDPGLGFRRRPTAWAGGMRRSSGLDAGRPRGARKAQPPRSGRAPVHRAGAPRRTPAPRRAAPRPSRDRREHLPRRLPPDQDQRAASTAGAGRFVAARGWTRPGSTASRASPPFRSGSRRRELPPRIRP